MIRVMGILLVVSFLQAEILEVKQLFNKKIVQVQSKQLAQSKMFYAKTALDESQIVDISLRFSGFIEKLYANTSLARLKKGETLFTIYSKELSVIKAELDLAKAMGQRSAIQSIQKKLSLLNAGNKISSDFTVDIKAPISGIILEKNINQGSFIQSGERLYKIANLSKIWVIVQVYQKDIAFIKKGMTADIMIEGLPSSKAKVDFIYPFMDTKTKMVDVRIVLDNEDLQIYPNLFAKVTLRTEVKETLTLPVTAVLTKGEKHFVFKPVGKSDFEPLLVEAKRLDTKTYEIISGLQVGDSVIDKALFMLDADAITNGLYASDDDWGSWEGIDAHGLSEEEWAW